MAAKLYPEARRALIARGRPEAQVEAMPVIQVAALYSMEEYQRIRDGSYKWMNSLLAVRTTSLTGSPTTRSTGRFFPPGMRSSPIHSSLCF